LRFDRLVALGAAPTVEPQELLSALGVEVVEMVDAGIESAECDRHEVRTVVTATLGSRGLFLMTGHTVTFVRAG
jgi:hypothetical protein